MFSSHTLKGKKFSYFNILFSVSIRVKDKCTIKKKRSKIVIISEFSKNVDFLINSRLHKSLYSPITQNSSCHTKIIEKDSYTTHGYLETL